MISACLIVLNEEKNIPKLIESLKECDEIIMADGGSTDNTVELARDLGANIYKRQDVFDVATIKDIDEFKAQFGYKPKFDEGYIFNNYSDVRNEVVKHAKNDWIFFPDADEFVTWDIDDIYRASPRCDLIKCQLVQTRDKNGNPVNWNSICKLYNKNTAKWVGRVHEVILGTKEEFMPTMKIDHYKEHGLSAGTCEYLEWGVLKDKDPRSMFYLMREYYYYQEWNKAIDMFSRYISMATWRPEIAYAFYLAAKCAWQAQRGDDARKWCLQAIAINPDFKNALLDMSEYTGAGQSIYWKRMSEGATNNDVLFV